MEEIPEHSLKVTLRTIFDQNKGNVRVNFPSSKNAEEIISIFKKQFEEAKLEKSIVEIDNFIPDSSNYEQERDNLRALDIPKYSDCEDLIVALQNLKSIELKEYESIEIPAYEIVSWIEHGQKIHEKFSATDCLFCGGGIDISQINEKIGVYKNDQKNHDAETLYRTLECIKLYKKWIDERYQSLDRLAKTYNIDNCVNYENLSSILNDLISAIGFKVKNIESKVQFDIHKLQCDIENLDLTAEKIKFEISNRINNAQHNLDNIASLVKAKIYIKIVTDEQVRLQLDWLHTVRDMVNSIKDENFRIQKEIQVIKSQMSSYSDFMNFLNIILGELDIKFRLYQDQNDEKMYILKNLRGENLSLEEISEGEKRLLSLIYFYFELFSDKEQNNFKGNEIELIVIDDPVTSLDESNKFYIIEIIKEILNIKESNLQVFVLTHSWDDFCDMTYFLKAKSEKNPGSSYSFYEVSKTAGDLPSSYIKKIYKSETPYIKLYKEIYSISLMSSVEELSDCNIYHSYNSMRKIFEEFLKFKSPKMILPQQNQINKIIGIIQSSTGDSYGRKQKLKLSTFLSKINVMSHKTVTADSLIEDAKFFMNLLSKIDKVHHTSIVNS